MARGVNKAILVGNLGQDPDIRRTHSGATVANLSLATNESWTDRHSGETRERTEWHRIAVFNRLAEIVEKYCFKGQMLYIEGRIQTDKWEDRNTGETKYTTKVIAHHIQMLSRRDDDRPQGGSQHSGSGTDLPPDEDIPF